MSLSSNRAYKNSTVPFKTHTHTQKKKRALHKLWPFRLSSANGSRSALDAAAKNEIKLLDYHKADINIKDTKFRASDVDIISTQILTKYHPALLEDSAPLQTIGDGNCLYRALSKLLTGHEESHKLIRLEVALELIIFSDRYDAKSKKKLEFLNDSRIVTSDIHKLIKDAIRLGSFSEMAHMYAASAAIKKPIRSYFPPQAQLELSSEPFTRTIVGRGAKQSNPAGCIMWTSMCIPQTLNSFSPNHFVPLVKKNESTNIVVSVVLFSHF